MVNANHKQLSLSNKIYFEYYYKYTMEAQKAKKPVGGKLLKQFSVREGAIPMVGKKVKQLRNNFKYFIKFNVNWNQCLKYT